MLVMFVVQVVLLIFFRCYLNYSNKRRDRQPGVEIDPESRESEGHCVHPGEPSGSNDRVEKTDWGNPSFRYHL